MARVEVTEVVRARAIEGWRSGIGEPLVLIHGAESL